MITAMPRALSMTITKATPGARSTTSITATPGVLSTTTTTATPGALSTTTITATLGALSTTTTVATLAGDRPPHKFSSPIMSATRSPSTTATLAEARPGKAKRYLGKAARVIKTGVGRVLRVCRRARMVRMWPLLQVLLLLGPVVLARPSPTLVLKREYEDMVVEVSEEDLDPGLCETRCNTKDGATSGNCGNDTTSAPPDHTTGKATEGLHRVYVVIICLVVAGLGVVVIYLYLRYGQAPRGSLGASVLPEVGESPLADPLLPIVMPNPDPAKVPNPNPAKILPNRAPLSPRQHLPRFEPRDKEQIRGMSPGCRERLAMTTPMPRRRIPSPGSGSIRTPELEDALRNLRRDAPPFDLGAVLPFRLWFEEDAGQPGVQDGVAAGQLPDVQDGAVGGQVVEEPLGGVKLHRIPVEEGEGQEEEKKQKRRKKVLTEEDIVIDDDAGPSSIRKPRNSLTNIKKKNDGPSINPEEILVRRKKSTPIEQWLEITEKQDEEVSGVNCSEILPISLNWIADNELHPDPGDCGGIDYALIYRYLACLCQGEAPPDLDPATAARVADFLPMLMGIVNKMDMGKEGDWLENYRETGSASSYTREEGFNGNSEAVKNMEMLSKIPGLNPLGIDAEVCVDRLIPMPDILKEKDM